MTDPPLVESTYSEMVDTHTVRVWIKLNDGQRGCVDLPLELFPRAQPIVEPLD